MGRAGSKAGAGGISEGEPGAPRGGGRGRGRRVRACSCPLYVREGGVQLVGGGGGRVGPIKK